MQMTPHVLQKARRTKEPLDESERGEWKSWLKTQHSENMAFGPITSWQIDGETVETVADYFFFFFSALLELYHCIHTISDSLL